LLKELGKYDGGKENLLRLYHSLDMTSLNSTDGPVSLSNWLDKNAFDVIKKNKDFYPAAICVYPNFTKLVRDKLVGT